MSCPIPGLLSRLRCLLLVLLLSMGAALGGCQCVGIVNSSAGVDAPTPRRGTIANQVPDTRGRYEIRGVAMLAFYPSFTKTPTQALDPTTGTMNGYVVLYEKLESTEIAAWRLADGECHSSVTTIGKGSEISRGLDGGQQVRATVEGVEYTFERREVPAKDKKPPGNAPNVIYNFPTVPSYPFPYGQKVRFSSGGAGEFPTFHIDLSAPSRLNVTAPPLTAKGIALIRSEGLALRWKTAGPMPYVAIRLNQHDLIKQETRSLLCRFANQGEGLLPAKELRKFQPDPEGKRTNIYFSPTTYKLANIPGLNKPILTVVRATTILPVAVK